MPVYIYMYIYMYVNIYIQVFSIIGHEHKFIHIEQAFEIVNIVIFVN